MESYTNQLSKFGFNRTPDELPTGFQQTHIKNTEIFLLKIASGFCPNQLSKFGYYQTTDRLQTDFGQSFDRLTLNPITDTKKFVGDDNRSQFGELSKSALQIWRAVQISSQIFGYYQTPNRPIQQRTPDRPQQSPSFQILFLIWLLSDSQKIPRRHQMDF